MRINPLAVVLLAPTAAFVPHPKVPRAFSLEAHKTDYAKHVMGFFAGMTLGSGVAFAALPPLPIQGAVTYIVQERPASESSSVMLSAFGAPTGIGGDSFSTMDFSMPSYSDGVSAATAAPKADVPSFNPFGREEDNGDKAAEQAAAAERKAAEQAAAAERKAAEQASAAERKAAEKAAKVAEKAAAEQAKAAEKAALEQAKADKAARRTAELEKQKEAVTRAAKKDEAPAAAVVVPQFSDEEVPAFKVPTVSEFKAPDMPEFKVPEMPKFGGMPKFDMPKLDTPSFDMPKMDMPKVDMPKFDMPKMDSFEMPKMDAPKFDMPKTPDIPKFTAPDIPDFKAPDMPKFELPSFSMPKIDTSKLNIPEYDLSSSVPSFSAPSFPSLGGGASSTSTGDESFEPQEVRDERAREGRKVFLDADKEAKAIEAQARAVRAIADDKKKIAKELKDDACKTHWGGKFLCLRPFNSGY